MADVVGSATRSRMMAGIRAGDTRPEMMIRTALHARGLRYRLHDRALPGAPDMVFPRFNAVVFVHGCFWHGHGCRLFRWPATRQTFWRNKITGNQETDARAIRALSAAGWRIAEVWECALKGARRHDLPRIADSIADWLHSDVPRLIIPEDGALNLDLEPEGFV